MKYTQADTFWERWKGLAWSLNKEQILFIPRCRSVHTFGMFFTVDLYWVSDEGEIIGVHKGMGPGKFASCEDAFGVLEVPSKYGAKDHDFVIQKIREFWIDKSGQALVETALIMPLILLFVFGFLQFSIVALNKQKMVHLNNYSVQIGALTNDDEKITGSLEESGDIPMDEIQVQIENFSAQTGSSLTSNQRRYNDVLTVSLQWEHPLLIPFFTMDSIALQTKSSSRILCRNDNAPYTCL